MIKTEQEYLAEQINKHLAGGAIRDAVISENGESVGFNVVKKARGLGRYDVITVWVDCDPEGNGSGWLQIESDGINNDT
jgi:uncharacterized protein with GYD domain